MIERTAQRDRIEPRSDIGPVEARPRPVRREVGVLRDVLSILVIAQDQDEPADECRVVGSDGELESVRVVAADSACR